MIAAAVLHPGTQHSWQTALALQQLGRLAFYATSIFHKPGAWPYRLETLLPPRLAAPLAAEFRRFAHPALDPALVRTHGWHEWAERIAARAGFPALAGQLNQIGNEAFGRHFAAELAGRDDLAIWAYNSSALPLFRAASQAPKIYDRTTPDLRAINRILDDLEAEHPAWITNPGQRYTPERIALEEEEMALADHILTGSEFAAQSLADEAGPAIAAKTRLLPYCYDSVLFDSLPPPRALSPGEPVRFLFAGTASARKGVHLACEAIARLPEHAASLTILGRLDMPAAAFAPFAERVRHIPHVARSQVPQIMAEHHTLIFPSLFEGGGIVLYEALAAGCALIQTPRASHAVTSETGLLLPNLTSAAVQDAMMTCIEDRDRLNRWRTAAPARARHFSFARYRDNIATLLAKIDAARR